jgi:glutamate racemase
VEVIKPGARAAVRKTKTKKVGVIATDATINSKAYQRAIKELQPGIEVFTQSCPLFVPLAEQGWCDPDDEVVLLTAKRYLDPLKAHAIDSLVLGCTHYPLLKGAIQTFMGTGVTLIDSAQETAKEVAQVLQERQIQTERIGEGQSMFFLTDIPHRFKEMARLFLGKEIENVHLIDIFNHQKS